MGHGLAWEESYPAIVGAALDLQIVNLATHGYGSDQAFLRLHDELPKVRRPVAVVSFFIPVMAWRTCQDDHPRLDFAGDEPVLTPWRSFFHDLHLAAAWREVVPYHGDDCLERAKRAVAETAKLRAIAARRRSSSRRASTLTSSRAATSG